jgi:hypothetical protein
MAAKELLRIREQFLLLITDCHVTTCPKHDLERRLDVLTRELTAVHKFSPDTSSDAYAEAEAAIKRGHFALTDDEIDAMLPAPLRKNRS